MTAAAGAAGVTGLGGAADLDVERARVLAEAFLRARVARWEELGCEVLPAPGLALDGSHLFAFRAAPHPVAGRVRGFGGAFPVVVDRASGACRFVTGPEEYERLRRRRGRRARGWVRSPGPTAGP
ncbi:hypothetical protein ACFYUY_11830 [Kitasatospora sp. NPDC004745]|uniref:hypothetical protein n=1 Tax=Kitasatospora sp. NPDC004745 TaxID=3364019 RepID=UPI00367DE2F5